VRHNRRVSFVEKLRVKINHLGRLLGLFVGVGALLGAMNIQAAETKAAPAKAPAKKAAAKAPAVTPAEAIVLRGDHSTTRSLKDLVKAYEAGKHGAVTVQPFSTISALDAVNSGTADIAGSARVAMTERAEEKGTNFYPVAWDAVVPIVSYDNPVSNISLKQLHDLYLGRVNNWSELGGPSGGINLYSISAPLDGVEFSARFLLFHFGDQQVSAPRLYVNVEKLEEGIVIDPHGIGFSTFSGVASNPKIKMLAVEGVRASIATISDGSYPLYSALYLASRDDSKKHDDVTQFVTFAGSEQGREILRKHDLVPYADVPDLINKQDTRIAFINDRVFSTSGVAATAVASTGTPVSAPNATAQALQRVAPTSERTAEAKDRAARASAAKADGT
jgi:phosphate transport system substrate-binding protein